MVAPPCDCIKHLRVVYLRWFLTWRTRCLVFFATIKKQSPGWGREWQPSQGPQGLTLCHWPPPHSPSFSPLGKKLGFTIDNGKLHNVSLGQGQEVVAENALDVAAESGHWVILQVGRPPSPPRLRPREPATGLGLGDSGAPTPSSAPSRSAGWHGASGASGASGPPGGSAGSSEARKTPGWTPESPSGGIILNTEAPAPKAPQADARRWGGGSRHVSGESQHSPVLGPAAPLGPSSAWLVPQAPPGHTAPAGPAVWPTSVCGRHLARRGVLSVEAFLFELSLSGGVGTTSSQPCAGLAEGAGQEGRTVRPGS